jgi:uncharacterized protein (DUF2235 family)
VSEAQGTAQTATVVRSRRLVLCLDGTSNKYAHANTNVVKICEMLEKSLPEQRVYYEPGIGTIAAAGVHGGVPRWIETRLDLAFGITLGAQVQRAYRFLMDQYRSGDKIYAFGFSRGAYTARVLAGMLYKVGLLEPGNDALVPFAWKMYLGGHSDEDNELVNGFSRTFCHRPPIEMLGLWDTVNSVRWAMKRVRLDNTKTNPAVRIVRHAVAIDERRAYFRQNLWSAQPSPDQDVKELWFPGTHCDVGGGHPEPEAGLSKVALAWMIKEAAAAGLAFDPNGVAHQLPTQPLPDSAVADALARLHESLHGLWWIPEFIPKRIESPAGDSRWALPRGTRRYIGQQARIHPSVVERQKGSDYRPPNLPGGLPVG